jgi:hypothetical protein
VAPGSCSCRPDLNPDRDGLLKAQTLLRKASARTFATLWRAVGDGGLYQPQECWNYLKDAGHASS